MLSPQLLYIILKHGAKRTIVIETSYTTIYFKGRHIEELSLEEIVTLFPVVFLL
jgi:hypothetical protein